ncbi:peptidoglycan-binding protein [Lentibacillus jeotgali]|uniref:peptidoglycan-binding protein n=1 Tax=Lentibacillus jeotgali TaxID=558169 RepID=UPI0002626489|nr:peptidoglycan-binding protein [Lentibacillus jeotgali]
MSKKMFLLLMAGLFSLSAAFTPIANAADDNHKNTNDGCIAISLSEVDSVTEQSYIDLADKYKSESQLCSEKEKEESKDSGARNAKVDGEIIYLDKDALTEAERQEFMESYLAKKEASRDKSADHQSTDQKPGALGEENDDTADNGQERDNAEESPEEETNNDELDEPQDKGSGEQQNSQNEKTKEQPETDQNERKDAKEDKAEENTNKSKSAEPDKKKSDEQQGKQNESKASTSSTKINSLNNMTAKVSDNSLQKGVRSTRVLELKKDLIELGFDGYGMILTKYFGDGTKKNIRDFQDFYRQKVTGVADQKVFDQIDFLLPNSFSNGRRHVDTIEFKKDLIELGFDDYGMKLTHYYGEGTEKNVRDFQDFYRQKVTGVAGQEVIDQIDFLLPNPFSNGKRHVDTIEFKKDLVELGFDNYGMLMTYFYGDGTEKNVRDFQKAYQLPVTGIADKATFDKVESVIKDDNRHDDGVLSKGDRSSNVLEMKQDLIKLGFDGYGMLQTKYFGDGTEKNLKDFQEFYRQKVTGVAGQGVFDQIDFLLPNPLSNGRRHVDTIELKKDLIELGFDNYGMKLTHFYGEGTEKNVRDFQDFYHQKVTGVAGEEVFDQIDFLLPNPFSNGKRHMDTIEFKKDLIELGFDNYGMKLTHFYGEGTEKNVRDFQNFYRQEVTGIAGQEVFDQINFLLPNPFSNGKRHVDTIEFKKDLIKLGFDGYGMKLTHYYGDGTKKNVRDFQDFYRQKVTGTAGQGVFDQIDFLLPNPFSNGKRHVDTIALKEDLIKLGFDGYGMKLTHYYGDATEKNVKDLQRSYNLNVTGIVDEVTMNTIKNALQGTSYTSYDLSLNEALNIQMRANPQTDQAYAYISKTWVEDGVVTASALNVRTGPGTHHKDIGTLYSGERVDVLDEVEGWYVIRHNDRQQWVNATPNDVRYYLNPDNFIDNAVQRFQFLDLAKPSNASAAELNSYLQNKGILAGKGQAFIKAANINGINDVYLASHAGLETSNGTSTLATGVPVDKNGNITRNSNGQIASTNKTVTTVYNMFGIGANDSCALSCGAKRAYQEGWTTPEKAIVGGAAFIGTSYIKDGQNTLYKMRWNPLIMDNTGGFGPQYATDIGWASKQVSTIFNLYNQLGITTLNLEIPQYN